MIAEKRKSFFSFLRNCCCSCSTALCIALHQVSVLVYMFTSEKADAL